MEECFYIIFGLLIVTVVIGLLGFIPAIPIYFLWNWLMPELFGLKTITFLQSWGLFLMANLLFVPNVACSK